MDNFKNCGLYIKSIGKEFYGGFFYKLNKIWKLILLKKIMIVFFFFRIVEIVLLYGLESWILNRGINKENFLLGLFLFIISFEICGDLLCRFRYVEWCIIWFVRYKVKSFMICFMVIFIWKSEKKIGERGFVLMFNKKDFGVVRILNI